MNGSSSISRISRNSSTTSTRSPWGSQAARPGVLRIEGIGYFDPDIVTFYGTDEFGAKTQLIQHVSQLGVTLRALPKQETEEAPKRIGFRLAEDLEKD